MLSLRLLCDPGAWFYKAGLCLSVRGTRGVVDRLIQRFDKEARRLKQCMEDAGMEREGAGKEFMWDVQEALKKWEISSSNSAEDVEKERWESELEDMEEGISQESTEESQMESIENLSVGGSEGDNDAEWIDVSSLAEEEERTASVSRRRVFAEQSVCQASSVKCCGYSLTWDNVQHLAIRRHQTSMETNKFHLWALAFMTENRIERTPSQSEKELCKAESLSLECFLPSAEDWMTLKSRMVVLVQRILLEHFSEMEELFGE